MKVINQICRYLTLALGIFAVVLFFFPFLSATVGSSTIDISGAQLAFGSTIKLGARDIDLAISSYVLFTFLLTAFATIMSAIRAFTKKGKGAMITSFITSLIAGIIMLVIALSKPASFADLQPLAKEQIVNQTYTSNVIITAVIILAFFAVGFIGWLVNDYVEVLAHKGQRLTIFGKVKKFVIDMVAEIKKIVWPGPKMIVKNSAIVLILCAILGAFIWIVDALLGLLIKLI